MISLLLLTALAAADPPAPHLTIPAEVKPSGQYVRLLPDTDCIGVTYVGLDGLEPVPSDVLNDKRLFLLDTRGLAVGSYRFAAIGAEKDGTQLRADFAVVVGTPPGPGPGPTPPPSDLTKALQMAYDLDKDADKAQSLDFLQGAFTILATRTGKHTEWKTNADAMKYEHAVTEAAGIGLTPLGQTGAQVVNLRTSIGQALLTDLGDYTKPIDLANTPAVDAVLAKQANLKTIAASFQKIANALGGVH